MEKKKKEGLKCEHCDVVSISKAALDIHLRIHFGTKPYNCSICEKAFSREGNCRRHETIHAERTYFECNLCDVKYTSKESLKKHLRFHTGENLFGCTICGRNFTQNSHLKTHLRTHTGEKPFQCSSCDKKFTVQYDLKMHQTVHEAKEMSCKVCGKRFRHLGSFRGHMIRHTKKKDFKCPVCGIEFHANCNLQVHMRIHTGEKPFKCTICNKAFIRGSRLKEHNLIHAKEKAFRNSEFNKAPTSKIDIKDQGRQYTVESHYCSICHRRYANKYSLNQHMKVHADKPIQCLDCLKVFTSVGYLKTHRENRACHVKRFSCFFCDQVFIKKVNIIIHIKKTHASEDESEQVSGIEKPLKCSICTSHFSSKRSLVWHEVCTHKLVEQIESEVIPRQNVCRSETKVKYGPCDKSDDGSTTRRIIPEGSKDTWNVFPENVIFIKEESVDEEISDSTLAEDASVTTEFEDEMCSKEANNEGGSLENINSDVIIKDELSDVDPNVEEL